jgi:ribosome-associated protein
MSDPVEAPSKTNSKEKAEVMLRAALSKKALDPVLMRLDELTSLTDYFLIVSARSEKHVTAVAEAILEAARKSKLPKYSSEGVQQGNWALLDYGDVVVHVFRKPVREFYDLEGLWAEAPRETFPEDILLDIEAAKSVDQDEEEWDDLYEGPV